VATECDATNTSDQMWELDLSVSPALWYGPVNTGVKRQLFGMATHVGRNSIIIANGTGGGAANLNRVDERVVTIGNRLTAYNLTSTWIAAGASPSITPTWTSVAGTNPCSIQSEGSGWSASQSSGAAISMDASGGGYDLRVRRDNNILLDCGGARGDINVRREVEVRSLTATPNPTINPPENVTLNWEIRAANVCRVYQVGTPDQLLATYTYTTNGDSPFGSHLVANVDPPDDGLMFRVECDGYANVSGATTTKNRTVVVSRPPPTYGGGTGNTSGIDVFEATPTSVPRRNYPDSGPSVTLQLKIKEVTPGTTTQCVVAFPMPGSWNIAAGGAVTGTGTRFQSADLQAGDSVDGRTITAVSSETAATATAGTAVTGGTGLVYRNCPPAILAAAVTPAGANWGPFYPQTSSYPTAGTVQYYMHVTGIGGQVLVRRDVAVEMPSFTNRCNGGGCNMGGATRGLSVVYDTVYGGGSILSFGGDLNNGYDARQWVRAWNPGTNTWTQFGDTMPSNNYAGNPDGSLRSQTGRAYFTAVYDKVNARTIINSGVDDNYSYTYSCNPHKCSIFDWSTCYDTCTGQAEADDRVTTFVYNSATNGWANNLVSANGDTRNKYAAVYADNAGWTNKVLVHSGFDLRGNAVKADGLFTTTNGGTSWAAVGSSTGPGARWGHAMAYDSVRSRVVMYGGCSSTGANTGDNAAGGTGIRASGKCPARLNDVMEWNNSTWTTRTTAAASGSTAPAARFNHNMAYDPVRQRMYVYGGCTADVATECDATNTSDQMWELDLAPATALWYGPVSTGVKRQLFGMAYHPGRGSIFAVNGATGGATNLERVDETTGSTLNRITKFGADRTWIPAGSTGTITFSWTTNPSPISPCNLNNYGWLPGSGFPFEGVQNGVTSGVTFNMDNTSPERRTRSANYFLLDCPGARVDITVRREVEVRSFTSTPAVVSSPSPGQPVTLNWDIRAADQCRLYRVDPGDVFVLLNTYNYGGTTGPTGSYAINGGGNVDPPLEGLRYQLHCDGWTGPGTAGTIVSERRVGRASVLSLASSTIFAAPGGAANLTWSTQYVAPNSCTLGTASSAWMWFAYNTQPTDGDRVLLADSQVPPYRVVFEFDGGGGTGGLPVGANEVVAVPIGGSAAATRDNFVTAINNNVPLRILAASAATMGLTESGSARLGLWTEDAGALTNTAAIVIAQSSGGRLMASGNNFVGGIDESNFGGTLPVNQPTPFAYDLGAVPAVPMLVCDGFDASGNYGRQAARITARMIHRKVEPAGFSATPSAIQLGSNSLTLNWNVVGAIQGSSCLLSGPDSGGGTMTNVAAYPFNFTLPPASPPLNPPLGLTNVNPVPETKAYRLSCTGDGAGNTFTTATPPAIYEDVQIFRRGEITTFTSSPITAYPNEVLSFSWTTASISPGSCSIDNGVGIVPDSSAGYPVTVTSPPATYVLTCNGDGSTYATQHGGPVSANISLERHVETTSITAEPVAVSPGGQSTLIYETINAINCAIDDTYPHAAGGIMAPATVPVPSGSWPTPALATLPQTFYIECSGTGGGDMKSVTVYRAAQINSFTVDQAAVHPGTTVQFSWNTSFTQANGCTISGTGAAGQNLATTGTLNFAVASPPTSYVLTCLAVNGNPAVSSPVTVQRRVEVTGFTASPNPVVPGFGTTFTFTTVNATSCWIDDPPYTAPRLYDASITPQLPNGTQAHTFPLAAPPAGITYRMNCSGIGTDHFKDFTVTPPSVVTISSFSATPTSVLPGGSTSLTWGSYSPTGTHTCQITGAAASLPLSGQSGTSVSSGAIASPPAVLTLTCIRGGDPNAVQTITIERRVQINSFTATPGTIVPFTSSTLAWSVTNATDCDIDGTSGFGPVVVPSGSMVISGAGTSPLSRTYTLTCRGPGGPVSQGVTVNEYAGTAIHTFTANPSSINLGEVVQLSWNTHRSTSCSINNGVGAVAVGLVGNPMVPATVNVTPASLPITYTLTCNGTGTPSSANANVTITDKGWVQVTSGLSGASSRDGAAGVYDPDRSRVYVMGGYSSSRGHLDDLWEWDGSAWTERCSSSVAPVEACDTTKPVARYRHTMAYDNGPARDRVVLFGGYSDDYGYLYDTWTWNAATGAWTQANDGSGAAYCDDYMNGAATSPAPRVDATMTFDASQNLVILYGGYCEGYVLDDIWSWNGTAWARITPTTTNAPCTAARPEKRFGHTLAYDSGRSRHVLYGGMGLNASDQPVYYPTAANGFTWEMQYTGGQWQWFCTTPADPNADGNPAPRRWAASAYDSAQSRTILFGGEGSDGVTLYNDTWSWYNNGGMTWRKILGEFPALAPRARATMVYDAAIAPRLDLLLISGTSASSADPVGDFWKWSP